MSTGEPGQRIRRPKPERGEPIRNWSATFIPDGLRANAKESDSHDPSPSARAVDLGYRIVDDYLRQGQNAARVLGGDRSYGPEAMANDVQEMSSRMLRYASDFAGVWFELMGMASAAAGQTPGAESDRPKSPFEAPFAAPPPRPAAGENGHAPETTRATREVASPAVSIELHSTQPTEVVVDLRPKGSLQHLAVHDLRAVDPEKPRLEDVAFEADGEDRVRVLVRIPEGQPPGTYNGVVVDDETSLPAGTLCVRIPT